MISWEIISKSNWHASHTEKMRRTFTDLTQLLILRWRWRFLKARSEKKSHKLFYWLSSPAADQSQLLCLCTWHHELKVCFLFDFNRSLNLKTLTQIKFCMLIYAWLLKFLFFSSSTLVELHLNNLLKITFSHF